MNDRTPDTASEERDARFAPTKARAGERWAEHEAEVPNVALKAIREAFYSSQNTPKANGRNAIAGATDGTGRLAAQEEHLSEGFFSRAWGELHDADSFLFADGLGWLRFEDGRWQDGMRDAQ